VPISSNIKHAAKYHHSVRQQPAATLGSAILPEDKTVI
jgi:hypothetical protein